MYLQFVVLSSFCPLCTISALLAILIVFLSFCLVRCPPLPEKRHAFQCGTLVVLSTVLFTVIEQRKTPDPVAFSIDDHAVRESELNRKLALSLQPLYESIYNAKLAGPRREIAQRLISEEAAKQSVSVDALLAKEVFSKINLPKVETEKGVSSNASLNGGPEPGNNTNQQVVSQLTDLLREQFVARLMQQHRVSILLRRPVPPRIAVDLSLAKLSGPPGAPVQLIVFSDFQCPYCAQLAAVLRHIREKFTNQVQVGFRYFPLNIHERARLAAQAAECADRQGKFWPFHDKLFSKQGSSFSADDLLEVARDIGLDTATFRGCLAAPEPAQPVEASYNDAVALGLDGAPSLFLNGKWIGGVLTESELSQRITEELTLIAQKH